MFKPRCGYAEVPLHRVPRRGRVFGLDRSGNRGVLVQARAKLPGRRHSEPARSFQMDAQRLENIAGARHR
jgi:hypothetical protein